MDSKIWLVIGIGAAFLLLGNKKTGAATPSPVEKSPPVTPVGVTPAEAQKPVTVNPATGTMPTWTNNPTPGEMALQGELAAATAAGQNLSPILETYYGPAWNLMVITQAQWNEKLAQGWTEEQLAGAYTTSETGRAAAIAAYWIARHPGEEVPDVLKPYVNIQSVEQSKPAAANAYGMTQEEINRTISEITAARDEIGYSLNVAQSDAAAAEIISGLIETAASGGDSALADYIAGGGILY
jgi:hypothetical protein